MKKTIFLVVTIILYNYICYSCPKNFYSGIELSELLVSDFSNQNNFNYTFLFGRRFSSPAREKNGWRILLIDTVFKNEHLKDEKSVLFIEGNRDNLEGAMQAGRFYYDWYAKGLKIKFLEIIPVAGLSFGYTNLKYINTLYNQIYDLKTLNAGIACRIHFEFSRKIFLEFPVIDIFFNITKNRDTYGIIGDTIINRPEYFGIFSWIILGINF